MAWTYSNWRSAGAAGSSARLTAMYAYEKELADALSNGKHRLGDFEHDPAVIQKELEALRALIADEEALALEADGSLAFMTRGRARRC